eukprot:1580904-Rhodomonas_salina.1
MRHKSVLLMRRMHRGAHTVGARASDICPRTASLKHSPCCFTLLLAEIALGICAQFNSHWEDTTQKDKTAQHLTKTLQ